jgi:hypothetical protein
MAFGSDSRYFAREAASKSIDSIINFSLGDALLLDSKHEREGWKI